MVNYNNIIESRRSEAIKKQLSLKAKEILAFIDGQSKSLGGPYKYVYHGDITLRGYGKDDAGIRFGEIEIKWRSRVVFDFFYTLSNDTILGYVPGDWEIIIDQLYQKAVVIRQARRITLSPQDVDESICKRWGIEQQGC